ncbi:general secretion pathway protein GspF [Solemya pervernicosa gill symbiont]|uniref:General secretion pathway protein GspF n=1 Tax=Solemya pervernicosa gill symbiont TaxID=642797 RepID=A0A1T2L337_9GAMM|nr:general secretion pathway protein GspF [Solemya pervernicosa gill symbiont]OOZ39538.1 general secretion pathway protein GspF [Solemya pervernicosa gill symbiont]
MPLFKKLPKAQPLDRPLYHADHKRPVTRRDFLAQGFRAGAGITLGSSLLGLLGLPRLASAALAPDMADLRDNLCGIAAQGAGKIPFICFDLAGGANIAGSNVLIGGQGGQLDFISTAGYSKLGLPGDMIPPLADTVNGGDFTDSRFGLSFHKRSAMLQGIIERAGSRAANINGAVIPARSDNDTGNNPHNPMYGINRAGADGSLVTLIGSRSSDSGGNSLAPTMMLNPEVRPTKVDRPSDVTGMVDTGELINILNKDDAVKVMESIARLSQEKLGVVDTQLANDAVIKQLVRCGYIKSADLVDRFSDPSALNPEADPDIVGAGGIFSVGEFNGDSEFRKTASVMKMVIDGYAGAGTITMGGYDYHTGERGTGERRDLRAGRCMGACLEYAARKGVPLMMYVFSDGSVASNGTIDDSVDGAGKGVWTGDNSSTAASFFLVYNPGSAPVLLGASPEAQARHQQIGWFRNDASVETAASPAANNVNLLVETVILNYLALHGEQNQFASYFPGRGLGNAQLMDSLTAFSPIVTGTI